MPPGKLLMNYLDLCRMVLPLCPNLKLSHTEVYHAMLKLNDEEGYSFLGTGPCGTCRHLSSCLRKSLERFRSLAVVADKRRQTSKAMHYEDVAETTKVVSSIDTSSHEDRHTVCEPEGQVGDGLALAAQHPVDSYGIARSHSAGSMMAIPNSALCSGSRCNSDSSFAVGPSVDSPNMDALPPQCFSEFLTKQVLQM